MSRTAFGLLAGKAFIAATWRTTVKCHLPTATFAASRNVGLVEPGVGVRAVGEEQFHEIGGVGPAIEVSISVLPTVFAAAVFISFLYLVSNGALNWGPAKRLQESMPERTTESTIARVGPGPGPGAGQAA